MARVAARVFDKRVLKLVRAFLNAGVMEDGLVRPVDEGTPQGGPLSPILSNLVLEDLDKELARRGHRFCRYADDCNIYVRSHRAGERVMASVSLFLTNRLRLKINEAKSAVARPEERKFLGSASRMTGASGASRQRRSTNSLAHVRTPGGPTSPTQPLFRVARSSPNLCARPSLTRSNRRGTDPYARWCGRGGVARRPPVPINPRSLNRHCGLAAAIAVDILN
jgi:Reverse transcriptase (RNA-dependent DNA polymerase)